MNSLLTAFPSVWLCIPLLIAVLYLVIHYLVYARRVAQWRKSKIPYLKPSFLIGHKYFFNLTKKSCLVSLDRIYRENSDKNVVGFFLGTIPMVLIRNPALIKQIFAKNFDKTFETAMIGSREDEVAQNTISLCADKALWKSSRRTLSAMYATPRMSGEAFAKIGMQIERLWDHAENAYRTGLPVIARQISANFMADALSNSLFSLDANSHKKQGELRRLATELFTPSLARMIRTYAQIQFPGVHTLDPLRFIGRKPIDSMTNIIRQQMEQRRQHQSNENDLVDLLMRLKNDENNGKQNSGMDITNQMIGYTFAIAFGGMNDGLLYLCVGSWAIHLLSLRPEHQAKIGKEVAEVMQKHKTSEFTYEVVRDLRFTQQCIYETFRLFPSVTAVTRIVSEDFQVPGTDHLFKKGERVIYNSYSVQRDPEYFENPEEFDPERFSPENQNTISPDAYLAFGTGPRKCPGEKLGIFMVAILIASLLYKFEIKPRSHLKQMDANDFTPKSFGMLPGEDVLVDIFPRGIMIQKGNYK